MSYAYEGLATIAVLALYQGQPPHKLTRYELHVRVLDVDAQRFRVEFDLYLHGPKQANALQVILPDGLVLQGPIVDGRNEPGGGWLLINVEPHELPPEPPPNLKGWKWE
ncbi:hypothetical protein C1893_25275 [Pseudomonas sp. MPR-ANC1]|uniref:hypothetical protein n=1 Tax=Pseudomonas sp. MPR-ANC1 TaxID=2075548 RepID=UPI000CD25B05|nr:hypothetical protein [Pseudomonas sp. MPR-ANC1]POA44731.1 hypothetical protein C1893_25275 [Pseudomonas sp. MPR-ANC1]